MMIVSVKAKRLRQNFLRVHSCLLSVSLSIPLCILIVLFLKTTCYVTRHSLSYHHYMSIVVLTGEKNGEDDEGKRDTGQGLVNRGREYIVKEPMHKYIKYI